MVKWLLVVRADTCQPSEPLWSTENHTLEIAEKLQFVFFNFYQITISTTAFIVLISSFVLDFQSVGNFL